MYLVPKKKRFFVPSKVSRKNICLVAHYPNTSAWSFSFGPVNRFMGQTSIFLVTRCVFVKKRFRSVTLIVIFHIWFNPQTRSCQGWIAKCKTALRKKRKGSELAKERSRQTKEHLWGKTKAGNRDRYNFPWNKIVALKRQSFLACAKMRGIR